jgi:hypothetical protein
MGALRGTLPLVKEEKVVPRRRADSLDCTRRKSEVALKREAGASLQPPRLLRRQRQR